MRREIEDILTSFNNFEDCIIEDITFKQFGFRIEFLFHYIFDDNKNIRPELNRKVNLAFIGVKEFRIKNNWNDAILESPENINWGSNEVSIIKISGSDSYLLKNDNPFSDFKFYHVLFLFEHRRRFDIVFQKLEAKEIKD